MRQATVALFLATMLIPCFSQKRIVEVEIREKGYSIELEFLPKNNSLEVNGMTYRFTPISPDDLNSTFLLESFNDGRFDYSHYEESRDEYIYKQQWLRREEKTDESFLLEGAAWLKANEIINEAEYIKLTHKVAYYFDPEYADKKYSQELKAMANPYYVGNKYLSVFQIRIENPSNSIKPFQEDILIESGDKLGSPLTEREISEMLTMEGEYNTLRHKALKSNHLKPSFLIPPNSSLTKYLAILPLEYSDDKVIISMTGTDKQAEWKITETKTEFDELFTYLELDIGYVYDKVLSDDGLDFNIANRSTLDVFIEDDDLFINEKSIDEKIEVFTLSLRDNRLYYGRTILSGSDYIDMAKKKRDEVELELKKIDDLKRRIKL